jgi:hypothetical protein
LGSSSGGECELGVGGFIPSKTCYPISIIIIIIIIIIKKKTRTWKIHNEREEKIKTYI